MTFGEETLSERLLTPRVGGILARNTLVSICTFLIGLALLWLLVEYGGMAKVSASGTSFLFATTLHYFGGRRWVYPGSTRAWASGYGIFLINAALGAILTMGLMAVFVSFTPLNYLLARVLVSVAVGLFVFVLNLVLNFRQA